MLYTEVLVLAILGPLFHFPHQMLLLQNMRNSFKLGKKIKTLQ